MLTSDTQYLLIYCKYNFLIIIFLKHVPMTGTSPLVLKIWLYEGRGALKHSKICGCFSNLSRCVIRTLNSKSVFSISKLIQDVIRIPKLLNYIFVSQTCLEMYPTSKTCKMLFQIAKLVTTHKYHY